MNANQIHMEHLHRFWGKFGGWKPSNHGAGFTQLDKLTEVRKLASLRIPFKRQKTKDDRRCDFNGVKHRLCRAKIDSPCFICGHIGKTPPHSRHHLIQLQNGGLNCRRNLVVLCDPCHADVHPWLKNPVPLYRSPN